MHLVRNFPPFDRSVTANRNERAMLCYVVTSFLALCANIYQNPEDPKASLDLKLMKIVTNFLSLLRNDEAGTAAHHLLDVCAEFERLARRAVKLAKEKQVVGVAHHRSPIPSCESNQQGTPISCGSAQSNGFLLDTEVSPSSGDLLGNGIPQQPAEYSVVRASDLTSQSQSPLFFNTRNTDASEPNGADTADIDFANSTTLPEYTGITSSSDLWQLPMPLEWNWSDMNSTYFPID